MFNQAHAKGGMTALGIPETLALRGVARAHAQGIGSNPETGD